MHFQLIHPAAKYVSIACSLAMIVATLGSAAKSQDRMPGGVMQFMGWGYGPGYHAKMERGTVWNPSCKRSGHNSNAVVDHNRGHNFVTPYNMGFGAQSNEANEIDRFLDQPSEASSTSEEWNHKSIEPALPMPEAQPRVSPSPSDVQIRKFPRYPEPVEQDRQGLSFPPMPSAQAGIRAVPPRPIFDTPMPVDPRS